jgi:hypothetical protein
LFESNRLTTSLSPVPAVTAVGGGLCAPAGTASAMTVTVASVPTIHPSFMDFVLQ